MKRKRKLSLRQIRMSTRYRPLTTTDAARLAGISTTSVVLAEAGTRKLGAETLERLAALYAQCGADITPDDLKAAQQRGTRKD